MKKRLWTLCLAVVAALCLCFGLAACGGDPTALATPTGVKVEGDTLSWDAVEGATEGYTVKIGSDETTKIAAETTTLDLTTVTAKLTAGENSIAVKANATEANLESEYSESVTYTYTPPTPPPAKTALGKPANVSVTGGALVWSPVTGATNGYTVKIGTDETTKVTSGTTLNFSDVKSGILKLGENTVAVKANATDANLESAYSDPVTYTYKTAFAAPTGVKVEGNTLSWNTVADATSYTVKIGTDETTKVTNGTSLDLTTVTDKLNPGANTLAVKADADDATYHTESTYSASVNYTYETAFAAPTNVRVEGTALKWDAVQGATAYTVKIGTEAESTDNTIVVTGATELDLTAANVTGKFTLGANKLSVKANATTGHTASAYSTAVDYTYQTAFAAPTGVKVTGDTLSWDAVTDATGYTVKINNNETTTATNSLDLTTVTTLLISGENSITVKANANAEKYRLESPYSSPAVTYTYTPSAEKEANDYKDLVDAIDVTDFSNNSSKADADAILAAIKLAEDKYNGVDGKGGLSQEAKALQTVTTAHSDFESKKTTFEGIYNPAKALADAYKTAVEAAQTENTKAKKTGADDTTGKTLASLGALVEAATTAKNALATNLAQSLGAEYDNDYNTVKGDYEKWDGEVDDEVEGYNTAYSTVPAEVTGETEYSVAQTAKTKIDAEKTAYAALSYEAQEQVKTTHATYGERETAYNNAMEAAQTAYNGFQAKLTAAQTAAVDGDDATVSALETAINAANDAKTGLSMLASGLVTTEDTEALTNLGSTLTTWKQAVETEVTKLTIEDLPELSDDASAEDIIVAIEEAKPFEGYDELPNYVKNDTTVSEKYAALQEADKDAKEQLASTVSTLESNIEDAIKNADVTEGKYETLVDLKDQVTKLGEYAQTLLKEDKEATIKKIDDAIAEVLAVPVAVETDELVIFNNDAKSKPAHLVIIRKYVNVLGDGIKLENGLTAASVSASEVVTTGGKDGGSTTLDGEKLTVEWNDTSKAYIITIVFTRIVYSTETASDKVTITYTVTKPDEVNIDEYEETETTVVVGTNSHGYEGVCYDNSHKFYSGAAQTLQATKGYDQETMYVSVYDAGVKEGDEYINGDISFKDDYILPIDLPLFTWESTEVSSLDALKAKFAAMPEYLGKEISVRLLVWQKFDENGITRYSAMNVNSLSEPITFTPTTDDLKLRLPTPIAGTYVHDEGWVEFRFPDKWYEELGKALGQDSMTAEEAYQLISYKVNVTLTVEKEEPRTQSFIVDMTGNSISTAAMKFNVHKLFGDTPENGTYTISVQLILRESAGTAYADKLRESYTYAGDNNEGIKWNFTVSDEDTKLQCNPATDQGNTPWNLGNTPGSGDISYAYEAVTTDQDLHDGVLLHIYNAKDIEDDVETHDFSKDKPFATYQHTTFSAISWDAINEVLLEAFSKYYKAQKAAGAEESVVYEYNFVFAMQTVPNEAAEALGYTASDLVYATKKQGGEEYKRETWSHTFTKEDITAPSDAQIGIDGNKNMTFLRVPKGGTVFTKYHVDYVLLQITKGETVLDLAFYYEFVEDETEDGGKYVLNLYRLTDGEPQRDNGFTGGSFNNTVGDAWCGNGEFSAWINTVFADVLKDTDKTQQENGEKSFDILDGWEMKTKVVVGDNSLWVFDSEWSDAVSNA